MPSLARRLIAIGLLIAAGIAVVLAVVRPAAVASGYLGWGFELMAFLGPPFLVMLLLLAVGGVIAVRALVRHMSFSIYDYLMLGAGTVVTLAALSIVAEIVYGVIRLEHL